MFSILPECLVFNHLPGQVEDDSQEDEVERHPLVVGVVHDSVRIVILDIQIWYYQLLTLNRFDKRTFLVVRNSV
jgi:hypothetical protein